MPVMVGGAVVGGHGPDILSGKIGTVFWGDFTKNDPAFLTDRDYDTVFVNDFASAQDVQSWGLTLEYDLGGPVWLEGFAYREGTGQGEMVPTRPGNFEFSFFNPVTETWSLQRDVYTWETPLEPPLSPDPYWWAADDRFRAATFTTYGNSGEEKLYRASKVRITFKPNTWNYRGFTEGELRLRELYLYQATTPPPAMAVESVTPYSSFELDIKFTTAFVQDYLGYPSYGYGFPPSATITFDDPLLTKSKVTTLDERTIRVETGLMEPGAEYTVSISGVMSTYEESLPPTTLPFTGYTPDPLHAFDLVSATAPALNRVLITFSSNALFYGWYQDSKTSAFTFDKGLTCTAIEYEAGSSVITAYVSGMVRDETYTLTITNGDTPDDRLRSEQGVYFTAPQSTSFNSPAAYQIQVTSITSEPGYGGVAHLIKVYLSEAVGVTVETSAASNFLFNGVEHDVPSWSVQAYDSDPPYLQLQSDTLLEEGVEYTLLIKKLLTWVGQHEVTNLSGVFTWTAPNFDLNEANSNAPTQVMLRFSSQLNVDQVTPELFSFDNGLVAEGIAAVYSDEVYVNTSPQEEREYTVSTSASLADRYGTTIQTNQANFMGIGGGGEGPGEDPIALSVTNLQARSHGDGRRIDLSWTNPPGVVWMYIARRQKNWIFDLDDPHDALYEGEPIEFFTDTGLDEQTYYYYTVLTSPFSNDAEIGDSGYVVNEPYWTFTDDNHVMGLSIKVMNSKEDFFWKETPEYYREKDAKEGGGFLDKWYDIMGTWLNIMRGQAMALKLLNDVDETPYHTLSAKNLSLGIEPEGFSYDYEIPRRTLTALSNVYKRRGTCPGMIRAVRMFTQWDAICAEMGLGGCAKGPRAFATWDGQSLRSEVTIAEVDGRRVMTNDYLGEDNLWSYGTVIGPAGDIACIESNTAYELVLKEPLYTQRVLAISEDRLTVTLSSVTGLVQGLSVQLTRRANTNMSEIAVIDSISGHDLTFTAPLSRTYGRNDYVSVGKSTVRGTNDSMKLSVMNGSHSTLFNPLLDPRLRGTIYDPFNRLWQGGGAPLEGAWGGADTALYITTPVPVHMGYAIGGVYQLELDHSQPMPSDDEFKGMMVNPNQNQTKLFHIVSNTGYTIQLDDDVSSLVRTRAPYVILRPRDANRYQALVHRFRGPLREFANMDIDVRIFFLPVDAPFEEIVIPQAE